MPPQLARIVETTAFFSVALMCWTCPGHLRVEETEEDSKKLRKILRDG